LYVKNGFGDKPSFFEVKLPKHEASHFNQLLLLSRTSAFMPPLLVLAYWNSFTLCTFTK
jgi:hypothetical protein